MNTLEAALTTEDLSEVLAVVRSYPEGITAASMTKRFGFSNSAAVRAALDLLMEKGQIRKDSWDRFFPIY